MTVPVGGFPTPQPQQPQAPQGYQQQGFPQQGGFPQQPAPQQAVPQPQVPQAAQGVDPNARIAQGDPRFPHELWGKTIGEAMRFYDVMRQDFIRRNYSQNTQQQQVPQQQQQQMQQQQPPRQGGFPQQQFNQNAVDQIVEAAAQRAVQAVQQQLVPVTQASVGTIYQNVRSQFSDWSQFEAQIQQSLQGAGQAELLNPEVWKAAYYHAKGMVLSQQGQQPQNQGFQQQQSFYPQQPYYQQPPLQQSFVEGPTPTAPVAPGQSQAGAMDEIMARRFGMTTEEYRRRKTPQGYVPPEQYEAQIFAQRQQAPQFNQPQYQQQQPQQPPLMQGGMYQTPNGNYNGY